MSNYRRYFNNNPVFITFVTKGRKEILIQNIDILRNSFKYAKEKYAYDVVASVILNEHCHIIISTENPNNIPKIIRVIKFNFSISVPQEYVDKTQMSESAIKRGEKGIWQRRYYDHIIRSEEDLNRHLDYIHYNPMKHYNIAPKDWKFSSFNKFVKLGIYDINWCNFSDESHINQLDYE